MFCLTYFLYLLVLGFIKTYKFLELLVLKLFKPLVRKIGLRFTDRLGLVLHTPGDKKYNTSDQENPLVDKTQGKYEKLIHFEVKDIGDLFVKVGNYGTLALGEAYMDGLWDACGGQEDLLEGMCRFFENDMIKYYRHWWNRFLEWLLLAAFNLQTKERALEVAKVHYDLGNDLFESMLDPWMQYSCGYWKDADNLNKAQEDKLELIAKKLDLKPGMRVLDIGCGWGTLCKYLAQNYGVSCVGVTISKEGVAYGKRINEGLPVEIRLQDYRDVNEKFDRIVSIGTFEHIGFKNYKTFMKVARDCLVDDGVFLLHTIARNHLTVPRSEPWNHKYIFPNGNLPTPRDIVDATEGEFVIEDWHNFGPDYAKTLDAWRNNFNNAWPTLQKKYDNGTFYRMWITYLCGSTALFRTRRLQLWQIVLSKDGLRREYRASR